MATCEVWLVYQRRDSLQKVQLIKLIKAIPRWRPTEGEQAADLVPGIFKLYSLTPCSELRTCSLTGTDTHVGEKLSCKRSGTAPETRIGLTVKMTTGAYFSPFPFKYIPWASRETQMVLDRHNCCQNCSLEQSEMHTYALLATHTRTEQTNWIPFGFHFKPWISSTFLHVGPADLDTSIFMTEFTWSPKIKFSLWFPASCSYETGEYRVSL